MAAFLVLGKKIITRVVNSAISQRLNLKQHNNFISAFYPVTNVTFLRSYRGSNRNKRIKARREQEKLDKQLEIEYGISSKLEFNFREWMMKNYSKEIAAFQNRIGIIFNDEKILNSAFAHQSFCNEIEPLLIMSNSENISPEIQYRLEISQNLSKISSEKLSLIGFEKTTALIKENLYKRYNNLTKSICFDVCTFLTSRDIISSLAINLGLEDFILMSREMENLGKDLDNESHLNFTKTDILCDSLFALIGAIDIDCGHPIVKSFVEDFILVHLDHTDLAQHVKMTDPHEELKKIMSVHGINSPVRGRTIVEAGVDTHFPFYHVGIFCQGIMMAKGTGYSTSLARTNAFENAVFMCLENEIDFKQLKRHK